MKIAIYNRSFLVLGGAQRRSSALASHLAQRHDVTLITATKISPAKIQSAHGIDLSKVRIVVKPSWGKYRRHFRDYDVFINNSHDGKLINHAPFGIFMCMFPYGARPDLSSYNVITANSSYTAQWIKRLWGYDSDVVYSACRDMGPPEKKIKTIVNVGLLSTDISGVGRKNQMSMLDFFIDLVRVGLRGWELQLIGNQGTQQSDADFIAALRSKAEGYPVRIEPDLESSVLRTRLRQASLYWHAMGYGTDPEQDPSRHEHFGMSVVEAMSAGAVPLALNTGGPSEVIRHGVDGYLWSTPAELQAFTLKLSSQPNVRERMSRNAIERAKVFNVVSYLSKIDRIIDDVRPKPRREGMLRRWLQLFA